MLRHIKHTHSSSNFDGNVLIYEVQLKKNINVIDIL